MTPKDPERLRVVADSPLARIALASAAEEAPSPELSDRMAKALGVSAAAAVGAGIASTSAQAAAAKTALTAGASATPVVPWIAVGAVVAVIVGGAAVGTWAWRSAQPPVPVPASAPHVPPAPPATESAVPPPPAVAPEPVVVPQPAALVADTAGSAARRPRGAHAPDLREQTAIIDGARAAIASGAAAKALGLARQYQERYPTGVFAPEAAALKIEALVRLDRGAEARSLAARFVATQPAGPLTERVKTVVRSARP